MPSPQPLRSLAAIVFTDIAGYSKLVHRDDARALKLLAEHFRMVRDAARRFNGREIKTIGDSVHLEFASAQAAATCAIAIQQLHQQRNARVAADDRFEIRIGLHLGDIEHRDGDVYGDGVNIAARLQPLAPVGGIAISDDVRRQLPEDLRHRFASLGAQELKNIDTPVQVFAIEVPAIAEISLDAPAAPAARSRARSLRWPPAWALITVGLIGLAMLIAKPWRYGPDGAERGDAREGREAPAAREVQDKSIAVLPFESLSEDKSNAFFAEGIQDQILTGLAKIGDLKVISRTSTQRYASRPDNLSQIARELGVAHVLEGSVQRAGNRVRINVQLIHARDDSHLWADTFDRTLDDVFAVQSEVAQKIADSLSATITQREHAAIARKPTENPQAYAAYLKARALSLRVVISRAQTDEILDCYREAVKRDPEFALAWAELSRGAILSVWSGLDPSGELADEAEEALDKAVALAPDLPQVKLARAYNLYYADRDFAGAAQIVDSLKSELPNESDIWITDGLLARRLGHLDQAVQSFERARALQPKDASLTYNLGVTRTARFEFGQASAALDATLALEPDDPNALAAKFQNYVLTGDLGKAADFLAAAPPALPVVHALRGMLALYQHDDATAAQWLRRAIGSNNDDRLDIWFDGYISAQVEWKLMLGIAEKRRGNAAEARKMFEDVRSQATRALGSKLETTYVEGEWRYALGLALAYLGEPAKAAESADRATAIFVASHDAIETAQMEVYQARVYAINGNAQRAVALAKRLLRTQASFLTKALLRVEPSWDPLRGDPAFEALVGS